MIKHFPIRLCTHCCQCSDDFMSKYSATHMVYAVNGKSQPNIYNFNIHSNYIAVYGILQKYLRGIITVQSIFTLYAFIYKIFLDSC